MYYKNEVKMSRLIKTEQIIELAMMFQNSFSGLCIDDIQEHFECSRRSAERMKGILFDLFPDKIEPVNRNDKKKYWRFAKGTMNTLIKFTTDDFANLEYLKNLSNDENRVKQLDEVIAKIKALTPQKNLRALETDIDAVMESEGFSVRQYSRIKANPKILETLRNAMISFKKIKFTYTKEVTAEPYGIIVNDKYYLLAKNSKKLKLYKINKIKDLKILDEYFEKDEKFNLQEYCNNSFGIYQEEPFNIVLEFDKTVKDDVINYHFHPSQKIKELENGNIEVKFKSGGKLAMCYEFFKWGSKVKIKKPDELKEYYQDYLQYVIDNV